MADRGSPFAIAFASTTTSGVIPDSSNPHIRPVRPNPVCTSSAISRIPASVQKSRTARRKDAGAGL